METQHQIEQRLPDRKTMIAGIRKVIKQHLPNVSVKMARGTAWGWVDILAGKNGERSFTGEEIVYFKSIHLPCGGNCANLRPQEVPWYYQLLVLKMEQPIIVVPPPDWD